MKDFVLVICWLGVAQSLLLGIYFLTTSKNKRHYFFLGLLLTMIGIRVAKSTIYLFDPDPSLVVINVGFAAHAMLGPLFLFYIQSITNENSITKFYSIHFVPAVLVAALSPYLTTQDFWYRGGYGVLLYYTLIYMAIGWYLFVRNYNHSGASRAIYFLLLAITVFQLSYFSNYILRLTPYEAGVLVHALFIYAITFLVLKNNHVFSQDKKKKYDNLNISSEEAGRYREKLIRIMNDQKPYLETDFSLARCAALTGIPPYVLSYVLSTSVKQNFLQFTNSYRVAEAQKLLIDPGKNHLSIAGIAQDCGFNTLSSFNTAFKKITGVTPSDYRRKQMSR